MPTYRYNGTGHYTAPDGTVLSEGDTVELSEYAYGVLSRMFDPVEDDESESDADDDGDAEDAEDVEMPDDYNTLRQIAADEDLPNADGRSGKDEILSDLQSMDDDEVSALIDSARED